jgi:hypothetical protein
MATVGMKRPRRTISCGGACTSTGVARKFWYTSVGHKSGACANNRPRRRLESNRRDPAPVRDNGGALIQAYEELTIATRTDKLADVDNSGLPGL